MEECDGITKGKNDYFEIISILFSINVHYIYYKLSLQITHIQF